MGAPLASVHRIDRARALLKRGQYAELLDEISSRLLPAGNPLFYWDRFLVLALRPDEARFPRRRAGPQAVEATARDLEALIEAQPAHAERVRARLRDGQRCFVIRDQGEIVARQWVVADQAVYDTNAGLRFVPPARPALWCHDIFVAPQHRLRGYFVTLMVNAFGLESAGLVPHLYGEVHFLNHGSMRAHTSLGYRVIRTVTVVSALGCKLYRIEDERGQTTLETRYAWRVRHI